MKTERIKLTQVIENKANPRVISDASLDKLVKSLLVFPQMLELRPVVVDDRMTVLGGNMRLRALNKIAAMSTEDIRNVLMSDTRLQDEQLDATDRYWQEWQEEPTATICRADSLTDAQKREFVIKDNVGYGDWNMDALQTSWNDLPLAEWGLSLQSMQEDENDDASDEEDSNNYERKIVPPVYEPSEQPVLLSECYDTTKVDRLVSAVNSAEISDDVKMFLRMAAYRHTQFNYEKIADYYAQAPKEIQALMEDSALVIIDFDKAIEDGFVKLSKDFMQQYGKEHGNDTE